MSGVSPSSDGSAMFAPWLTRQFYDFGTIVRDGRKEWGDSFFTDDIRDWPRAPTTLSQHPGD